MRTPKVKLNQTMICHPIVLSIRLHAHNKFGRNSLIAGYCVCVLFLFYTINLNAYYARCVHPEFFKFTIYAIDYRIH